MDYKFYRVTEGPMIERLAEIKSTRDETSVRLDALAVEYGATEVLTFTSGSVAAFKFNNKPDLTIWKKVQHGWLPKVSTKEGKIIGRKIKDCGLRPPFNDALKVYGVDHMMILGEASARGMPMHNAQLVGHFDDMVFFVKVPYTDSEPYVSKFDTMVEVEEWEMMKHLDSNK